MRQKVSCIAFQINIYIWHAYDVNVKFISESIRHSYYTVGPTL